MSNFEPEAKFWANAKEKELLEISRIFKELSSVVWSIEAETQKLLYVNEAAIALYERPPAEFEENPGLWRDAIAPEDRQRVQEQLNHLAPSKSLTLEYVILCPQQKRKRVSHRCWAVTNQNDEIERIEGIIDVVSQSHRQLDTLANNLPGIIYQYVTYPDGNNQFTYVSPACETIMELTPEQICQDSSLVWGQVHPEDLENFQKSVITSAQNLSRWQHQWRIMTASGRLKWMSGVAQPEQGFQGEIIWDGVMFDISDRIVAQAALQDSETRYQSLINAMSEGIALLTTDGILQACNPSAQRMLGMNSEIPGSSAFGEEWQAIDEAGSNIPPTEYPIVKALHTGQPTEKVMGVHKPNGGIAWLSVNAQPMFRQNQSQPYAAIASFTDITERKQAEHILRDREIFLRSIYDGIEQLIFVIDVTPNGDFRFAGCNPTAETVFGFRSREIMGKTPEMILGQGKEAAWIRQHYQRCYNLGQAISYEEFFPHLTPSRWFLTTLNPLRDKSNRIYRLIGTATDITERKQAEHNLSQREQYLSALVRVQRYLLTLEGDRCEYNEILAYLGQASHASRVYVFENYLEGDRYLSRQVAEWCASGISSELNNPDLQNLDVGVIFSGWDEILNAGEVIAALTENLPSPAREQLEQQNIKSILLLPIRVNDSWFGFIGFDNCVEARLWETLEINLLRAAADAIALWQESAIAEAALRTSTAQLQRQAQREALLNRLARQIRNSLDLDTILETAVREVQALLKLDRASFSWYRPELDPPCWEVVKQVYAEGLPTTIGRYEIANVQTATNRAIQGIRQRIDNLEECLDEGLKTLLQGLGYTSYLAIPIQTQSGRIGLFSVGHCRDLRPWRDSEVELLEAVVGQLAIAIDQAQLYAQTQRKTRELEGALRELRRTQSQLIQTEKMSSLGQMVAGVAHEINNPVNFIYGNLSHVRSYCEDLLSLIALYDQTIDPKPLEIAAEIENIDLEFLQEDLPKILQSMQVGAERISAIVKSLRTFSRLDEADKKAVDLHENLDSALMILQNRLKAKPNRAAIELIKHYGDLPRVECYPGQLNQVFINLMANAIDALEEKCDRQPDFKPHLKISTALKSRDRVIISIADNGLGIHTDKLSRIFDPFYTTKPIGRGTGLGLSISYQIVVDRHGGDLHAASQWGEGTKFTIEIPC